MESRRMGTIIRAVFGAVASQALSPVLIALSLTVGSLAQTPSRPAAEAAKSQASAPARANRTGMPSPTVDLSGVWSHNRNELGGEFTDDAPMQPWAAKVFQYNRDPVDATAHGRNEVDPYDACFPPGVPRIWFIPRPVEIIQSPGRVLIFYESDHWRRQIWADGREHPKDLEPSWMGHSIGRWDGDALIVDTVGLKGNTWLDTSGHPHSDALHIVERIRRVDHNNLELTITYDDPKAYTKAWSVRRMYRLRPDWVLEEVVPCEDKLLREDVYNNR